MKQPFVGWKERRQTPGGNSWQVLESPEMITKPQLFGTDGVRGVAGEYPLDPVTVQKLGRAPGMTLG